MSEANEVKEVVICVVGHSKAAQKAASLIRALDGQFEVIEVEHDAVMEIRPHAIEPPECPIIKNETPYWRRFEKKQSR